MSSTSSPVSCSSEGSLPASSYDGSHLHWKTYRQDVLGPHRIRIFETPASQKLPQPLVKMIEMESPNFSRFAEQMTLWRKQVAEGQGFGRTPLFPPNALPPLTEQPLLTRCMAPVLSREALPERTEKQSSSIYEVSAPRPLLCCGFSGAAFSDDDTNVIPSWLVNTGTIADFSTGNIRAGIPLYGSFLTFEHAAGDKERRIEAAQNRCAIDGSWSLRATQMLYAKAWKGHTVPELPVAFSCTIDSTFVVLNFHWIDHCQAYCMAPLCRFDLTRDAHYGQFMIWIDCIGKWAVSHVLPLMKSSLERLRSELITPPATPRVQPKLTIDTSACTNELILSSLQTTFSSIPWHLEGKGITPVSSSTASWGSPMVTEVTFSNLAYPEVPPSQVKSSTRRLLTQPHPVARSPCPTRNTPPPAYAQNPELVWSRRFNHAMDEIRELQSQLSALKSQFSNASTSLQSQIGDIKGTMESVLRKENLVLRNRSLAVGMIEPYHPLLIGRSPLCSETRPRPKITFQPGSLPPKAHKRCGPPTPNPTATAFPVIASELPSTDAHSPVGDVVFNCDATLSTSSSIELKTTPIWQLTTMVMCGKIATSFMPSVLLRVLVLGCITDTILMGSAGFSWSTKAVRVFNHGRGAGIN